MVFNTKLFYTRLYDFTNSTQPESLNFKVLFKYKIKSLIHNFSYSLLKVISNWSSTLKMFKSFLIDFVIDFVVIVLSVSTITSSFKQIFVTPPKYPSRLKSCGGRCELQKSFTLLIYSWVVSLYIQSFKKQIMIYASVHLVLTSFVVV